MSANVRVVLVLVLLIAGVGLIAYFATQDPAPIPTGPDGSAETDPEVEAPPVPIGRPGTLTGVVRVFKTEEPAADIEIRIEGAGDPITKKTNARGIFAASVPSGPEVTVTAFAPKPYADVVVRGVTVKPDTTTSLGTLYLERALVVKGIIVDRAGRPVPGAAVSAFRPVIGDSPAADFLEAFTGMTKPRTPMDTGKSGEDGRFTLRKLSPGTYRIEARADGFAVGAVKKATVSPESVRVEHRIVLGPGFSLEGEVTTSAGHPVPDALVSAIRMDGGPGGLFDFSPVQTRTDEEGQFSFGNLSAGRATLAVRAAGYPTKTLNEVNVGQSVPLKIVLGGTASIRGRITSGDGTGVEGAAVTIAIGQRGGAFGETNTDADGRYHMENLPEGRIQFMRVEAAGLAPWPVIDNPMMFQKGFGDLKSGEALVKDIEMTSGSRVFGRVTSKADGQPIGGAGVYLMAGFSAFLGASAETVTEEDGTYEVTGVAKGLHQVVVKAPGFYQTGLDPRFMQRAFGFGMGGKAPEGAPEVTTTEGGPDQRMDIALTTGATAVGTVVSPDNEPVAGARVTVMAKPDPAGMFMPGGARASGPTAITDENGEFRLLGLEAGDAVKFEAEADEWVKGESEPVSLAAGRDTSGIVVTLRRGGFLTGTITGYEGGPLAGAEIRTLAQPENATGNPWQWEWQLRSTEPVTTDEQGRFRVASLTPGSWILRAEAPGHRLFTKLDIKVPEGGDGGPVDIKLEKGLQITGIIVDSAGKPIPNVNLWTNVVATSRGPGGGNSSIRNATTNSDGTFTLDQLEPGSYSFTVNANGYANRTIDAVDAGTSDLRIVLEKGLSIAGRVLLPDGSPAENVWVSAQDGSGNSGNGRVEEDGSFEIENLPDGIYVVRANTNQVFRFGGGKDDGPSVMPAAQEGVPAGTENLELRLQAGATVEGRVTDESGQAIQGASVFARSIGEGSTTSGWGQTDENGEFRITGLTPGLKVSVNVSHGDYGPLPMTEADADAAGLTFVLPPKPEPLEPPVEPDGQNEATPR